MLTGAGGDSTPMPRGHRFSPLRLVAGEHRVGADVERRVGLGLLGPGPEAGRAVGSRCLKMRVTGGSGGRVGGKKHPEPTVFAKHREAAAGLCSRDTAVQTLHVSKTHCHRNIRSMACTERCAPGDGWRSRTPPGAAWAQSMGDVAPLRASPRSVPCLLFLSQAEETNVDKCLPGTRRPRPRSPPALQGGRDPCHGQPPPPRCLCHSYTELLPTWPPVTCSYESLTQAAPGPQGFPPSLHPISWGVSTGTTWGSFLVCRGSRGGLPSSQPPGSHTETLAPLTHPGAGSRLSGTTRPTQYLMGPHPLTSARTPPPPQPCVLGRRGTRPMPLSVALGVLSLEEAGQVPS